MKRVFLFFIALCVALYFGGARLFEYALTFATDSPLSEIRAEEVKQSVAVMEKRVVKLPTEDTVRSETSMEKIVDEFLKNADRLEKEFKINIGNYSEDAVVEEFLEQRICHSIAWFSVIRNEGTILTVKPMYRVLHEISYAQRTGGGSISNKALASYEAAKKVISETITGEMSDYEKELAIHDYLVLNTEYDVEAAKLDEASDNEDSFSAYGILVNKKGVCQAYSETVSIFMLLLGIECREVSGDADGIPHTWNIIGLDGEYYHLDVTWDNPVPNKPGEVSRAYFNLTDEMISRDHVFESDTEKCVSEKYNYFYYNDLVVKSQADFERAVTGPVNRGETFVEMRLEEFDMDEADISFAVRLTGLRAFEYSEASGQNVVKIYLYSRT